MLNAACIAKKIRRLRTEKKVSQEQMALDLGMYQADVSNLERAMPGSGISDLFKLERIAEYFGISLTDLLTGIEEEGARENGLSSETVAEVRCACPEEDVFISEARLEGQDGTCEYLSFREWEDRPCFYRSEESLFGRLADAEARNLRRFEYLAGADYVDIFENMDPAARPLCRLLILAATECAYDAEGVTELTGQCTGKQVCELNVPVPSREPEELFRVDFGNLSMVYRCRLMMEAELKNPSVYADLEDEQDAKQAKNLLEKLKSACVSEEAYKVWKKDLIDAKVEETMKKEKIVACGYLFAGVGSYKKIMREEDLPGFYGWIMGNGSAFCGEPRPATKREIRTYVAQHIADDLL